MIGDKYIVKQDCFDGIHKLTKGEILTEKEAYNFETECREDGGEYNELTHNIYMDLFVRLVVILQRNS